MAAGRARNLRHLRCDQLARLRLAPGDDVGRSSGGGRGAVASCRSRRCRNQRAAPAWSAGTRRCCRRAGRAGSRRCCPAPDRRRTRHLRADPGRNSSPTTPTACRRVSCSSPIRCRKNNETQPGQRAYNIVWYRRTTPERLADFCTDATGKSHGTSIPPPLLRPDVIAWGKAQARELVAPQVAEIFERDPRPFFQAIFDFASPQIVFGRVALLGDAAFTVRPHPGAGTTKCCDGCRTPGRCHRGARHRRRACVLSAPAGRVRLRSRQKGQQDGSYISDQLKPREQRRNKDVSWGVDDLMRDHDNRTAQVNRIQAESKRA